MWVVFGFAVTLLPLGGMLILVVGKDFFAANTVAGQLGSVSIRKFLRTVIWHRGATGRRNQFPDECLFVWLAFLVVFPLSVMFSTLRYRLWDIDVVIRKTLLYAGTSALLALVFFGSVVLLQRVFEAATGQQSQLAIVLSTLAIAALFNPLRNRIQAVIDRRFHRKKHDAQQVLAQFAITARNETDMNALTAELARVVQETMAPDGVTVWLRRK